MSCPDCGAETTETAETCPDCGRSLAVPVGTVLAERYEIQSLLGSGGLGRVYRAHDRMLDEEVAVKVLHPEAARSPELSKRFRSEIKLARKVRHRNVCAILEDGEPGPYRFVAMELVDGVDLHQVIRERGPLAPRDAFEVAIQVVKGLTAIHDAGVLHRDLKTPNIMRDRRGVVRLLDFGSAKLLTPSGTLAVCARRRRRRRRAGGHDARRRARQLPCGGPSWASPRRAPPATRGAPAAPPGTPPPPTPRRPGAGGAAPGDAKAAPPIG